MWTLGRRGGKKWKGLLGILVMGLSLVTGFLVVGGGVRVKTWQSVGSTLFCEPPVGVTTSSCPVCAEKNTSQEAGLIKAEGRCFR